MTELPTITFEIADTFTTLKVHKLAYRGQIAYGSFIGTGNAVKVLRNGLSKGLRGNVSDGVGWVRTVEATEDNPRPYRWRQASLPNSNGYVKAEMLIEFPGKLTILQHTDDEWLTELMGLSSVPILPDWVPYLRDELRSGRCGQTVLTPECINCHLQIIDCDDATLSALLIEGVQSGKLSIPDCEIDMGTLKGLPDYIHAYAQKMVESAGSALRPLFDPKLDTVSLPTLSRNPFTPQGWVIEAMRRAIA